MEYEENTSVINGGKNIVNKYFQLKTNNPIRFWGYASTILIFLTLILFGAYLRQSPNMLYLNVKGLAKDSLEAIPLSIKEFETSGIYKLTSVLDDIINSDRENEIYSKIGNLSLPDISICYEKTILCRIRSIIGKKDIYVDVK